MKATEQLVDQLKTQITDLERFIEYIQSKLKIIVLVRLSFHV